MKHWITCKMPVIALLILILGAFPARTCRASGGVEEEDRVACCCGRHSFGGPRMEKVRTGVICADAAEGKEGPAGAEAGSRDGTEYAAREGSQEAEETTAQGNTAMNGQTLVDETLNPENRSGGGASQALGESPGAGAAREQPEIPGEEKVMEQTGEGADSGSLLASGEDISGENSREVASGEDASGVTARGDTPGEAPSGKVAFGETQTGETVSREVATGTTPSGEAGSEEGSDQTGSGHDSGETEEGQGSSASGNGDSTGEVSGAGDSRPFTEEDICEILSRESFGPEEIEECTSGGMRAE